MYVLNQTFILNSKVVAFSILLGIAIAEPWGRGGGGEHGGGGGWGGRGGGGGGGGHGGGGWGGWGRKRRSIQKESFSDDGMESRLKRSAEPWGYGGWGGYAGGGGWGGYGGGGWGGWGRRRRSADDFGLDELNLLPAAKNDNPF